MHKLFLYRLFELRTFFTYRWSDWRISLHVAVQPQSEQERHDQNSRPEKVGETPMQFYSRWEEEVAVQGSSSQVPELLQSCHEGEYLA